MPKPCKLVSPPTCRNRRCPTKCSARLGTRSRCHGAADTWSCRFVGDTVVPVRTFHYRWEWQLRSSPDALWPLVTDTNRFNRDVGVPHVERAATPATTGGSANVNGPDRRRLRLVRFGIPIEWEEEPFEWTRPSRFGVMR